MKKLLFSILLFFPVALFGQQAPDNEAIKMTIVDGSSEYYYPNLFARYIAGDTTLTQEAYYYLYYGYAYQENYRPLDPGPQEANLILNIFDRNPEPAYDQCLEIIKYGNIVMKRDPFNPRNINFMTYACGAIGDTANEKINHDRFVKILNAIKSSGTGLKESSPWHVLCFSHANDVVAAMGLNIIKRTVVSRTVEYAQLEKNDVAKGYFFDFGRAYWKRPDILPEKNTKGMEFNMEMGRYKKK